MVITISFVSKGGRGLRSELVSTMCDKLGRNILCSVFCPFEYLKNNLHASLMVKNKMWTASGTGRVKINFQTQILINAICRIYKRFAF
ncbi:unnamed protein product [Staurois parvus]|uniref:Uncharacterized protein n=1 Tax=Staurois parvus TaxID=386267 RepID=A0ABN9B9V0_9NEOB|nr:unnamed protein product [Staurois parvus]